MRFFHLGIVFFSAILFCRNMAAQSTLATILGTIRDASGAVIARCTVKITDTDTGTEKTVRTGPNGNYQAVDMKPDHYKLEISQPEFQTQVIESVTLAARQSLRIDGLLQVAQASAQTTVESSAGIINTESQQISASFDSKKVLNLPGNYRANGSTSPYTLISALPGVQSDSLSSNNSNQNANNSSSPTAQKFSIQGGLPSQSDITVDGISTEDVTQNNPLKDAFPSAESIAEIRVDGVGNNAEYGQPGEVSSISKSGTNELHGAAFWYFQNRAFDALGYGQLTQPQKIANDYGISAGGPVIIPHLYDGRDKSFFFGTFEGFQFPRGLTQQYFVPTTAARNGDFSGIAAITDPTTGAAFPNAIIPQNRISPVAQKLLDFFPTPNNGDTYNTNNYNANKINNYSSNQFDVRGDQYLSPKMSVFGRFTWKNIDLSNPEPLLFPNTRQPTRDRVLVLSDNYTIAPSVVNEFRFGLTLSNYGQNSSFNGAAYTNSLGLQGIGPNFPFNGFPWISFTSLSGLTPGRLDYTYQSRTIQYNDNLSWSVGRHTLKFGADVRQLRAFTPLTFGNGDNYGSFTFNGAFTGNEFADFLLGLPQQTQIDNITVDNDGAAQQYNFYAQDSFKVSPRLTVDYGVRYEFHTGFKSANGAIGNFDPSVPLSGRAIYPSNAAVLPDPMFLQSINACPAPPANGAPCTPVVTSSQAGLPSYLKNVPKYRFLPRFGFAYRVTDDAKTVIRGGFDVFNITELGSSFYSLTGLYNSNTRSYVNVDPTTNKPIFAFPTAYAGSLESSALGTGILVAGNQIHWSDPYSYQWNLSVGRDLGHNIGLRISYIALVTRHLIWQPNINQLSNSTEFATSRPLSDRPFPNFQYISERYTSANANYQSGQVEVTRRLTNGLTFNSTYTFAKNLADNQGPNPSAFTDEIGGSAEDAYNRRSDYGNVYGTRRHRWITTSIYELPIGRGRQFGGKMNRFLDAAVGGWQLSGIFLWQSGTYLSPYFTGGDPSGSGSAIYSYRAQHPDRALGVNPTPANQNRDNWIDPNAFLCPGVGIAAGTGSCNIGTPGSAFAPIGRFGNAGTGILVGPGTVNLSAGLSKYFLITEGIKLKAEGTFTNVLNHTNLDDPVLDISNPSFGRITDARLSDFGGYRTGQVSLRLEF